MRVGFSGHAHSCHKITLTDRGSYCQCGMVRKKISIWPRALAWLGFGLNILAIFSAATLVIAHFDWDKAWYAWDVIRIPINALVLTWIWGWLQKP